MTRRFARVSRVPLTIVALALTAIAVFADDGAPVRPARKPEGVFLRQQLTPASPERKAADANQDLYDVTKYFLDLEFIPASHTVSGSVTITATSLANGLNQVVLDFYDNMSVTAIRRGTTSLTFTRGSNLLTINLDRSFNAGQSFEIKVTYTGVPQSVGFGSIGWNKYFFGSNGQMVWTLSEPEGARSWWPCKDRPDDKAAVEEWWTVPGTWTATGNGVLIASDTPAAGKKRFKWRPTHPLTSYLVSCTATVFSTFTDTYTRLDGGTMPVTHYVYSELLTKARTSFSNTPAMIHWYAQTFGEYPFVEDKYGMTTFPWSGAMEHSTNTSYGYIMVDGGHGNDYTIAHELAHQWWGDSVSPRTWKDVWLNEGFASWSEASWAEHLGGASSYHDYMLGFYQQTFAGTVYDPSDLFGSTVYNKGAWVLHMLRGVVGDTAFFGTLRAWYANNKDGVGDTAQFQALAESFHGQPLDWFFDEWVYKGNSPAYQYGWTTADLGDGTYRNWVRIQQTQTDAGTFTMPVQLTLVTASGRTVRTVWDDQADEYFPLDTAEPLTDLVFDENDWILKYSTGTASVPDADADGVPDAVDNCAATANATQTDLDHDGLGDACDPDIDGDGLPNAADCAPYDVLQGRPGEVQTLAASPGNPAGTAHVAWTATPLAGVYDVQRGALTALSGGSYGSCWAPGVTGLSIDDPSRPAASDGWLYLVAGRNLGCGGEGPLGSSSTGTPIPPACP